MVHCEYFQAVFIQEVELLEAIQVIVGFLNAGMYLVRDDVNGWPILIIGRQPYSVFTLSGTGTETGTGTRAEAMGKNRSGRLSYFVCNVKAFRQFHTTHLFVVPVLVSVPAGVCVKNIRWHR